MQRLLGGWGPPLPKAPSSAVCLGALCSLGLDLQVIRLTPSGVPTTLVLVNCYQVGVPGLGPGGVPRESHHGHWMEQGGTLEASSSSPFLLTPTLANLDYLLGQKPGFLSGSPLPVLEIGERTWDVPAPSLSLSVSIDLNGTSAIMSVSLSHLPQELENALYSGGEPGKPPSSLLAAPEVQFSSTSSFLPQSHITGTQRPPGNLSPAQAPSLMAQRKSDHGREVTVVAGGQSQHLPSESLFGG